MNRTSHLIKMAKQISNLSFHIEHIVIDFGSVVPIKRSDLPEDQRIRLHRIENPYGKWWLTHAFNVGFSLSNSDFILKLDADVLLTQRFADELLIKLSESQAHLICSRLTFQDWSLPSELFTTNGLFLCKRSSLEAIKGFNPYIRGWGWDEIDLYCRFFMAGFPIVRLSSNDVVVIEHGDDQREPPIEKISKGMSSFWSNTKCKEPTSRMRAQNEKNRQVAIASMVKNISWPSLLEYRETYFTSGSYPILPKVNFFEQDEYSYLLLVLARMLLNPSPPMEVAYRVLHKLGTGPYTPSSAKKLIDSCGVDLSLVI
jgi:glycosyltransferase involved in cell wall biosynthesis